MESLGALILNDTYRDSVFLMKISDEVIKLEGVVLASAMMGTDRNKDLFKNSDLFNEEVDKAGSDDLVVAIRAEGEENVKAAIKQAEVLLSQKIKTKTNTEDAAINRLEHAIEKDEESNLVLISVAGDYAKFEAAKALNKGLNVMLYSDNISIEDELKLKKYASSKGLIVMGPDCGTSIINGVPLAFANHVKKGNIGVVGASGTGIQEVTTLIDRYNGGITHAIGTGGRDTKDAIGGITMMDSLEILNEDQDTEIIVIITKPPGKQVQEKITEFIKSTEKKVVVYFSGADDYTEIQSAGGIGEKSLLETAIKAVELSKGKKVEKMPTHENVECKFDPAQKYLVGIFGGGSLCYESMYFAKKGLEQKLYSNGNMDGFVDYHERKDDGHLLLDMGEDEFTVGKPHPMINPETKIKRTLEEMGKEKTAVILTDCVIGYGAHEDPAGLLRDEVLEFKERNPKNKAVLVASVCGTEGDPQVYSTSVKKLEEAGIIVANSNYEATQIAIDLVKAIEGSGMNA